jgi:hypothetical protein
MTWAVEDRVNLITYLFSLSFFHFPTYRSLFTHYFYLPCQIIIILTIQCNDCLFSSAAVLCCLCCCLGMPGTMARQAC